MYNGPEDQHNGEAIEFDENDLRTDDLALDELGIEADPQERGMTVNGSTDARALQTQQINLNTVFTKMREYEHFDAMPTNEGMMNLLFEATSVNRAQGGPDLEANGTRLVCVPVQTANRMRETDLFRVEAEIREPDGTIIPLAYEQGGLHTANGEGLSEDGKEVLARANGMLAENVKRQIGEIATSLDFLNTHRTGFLASLKDKAVLALEERVGKITEVDGYHITSKLVSSHLAGDTVNLEYDNVVRDPQNQEENWTSHIASNLEDGSYRTSHYGEGDEDEMYVDEDEELEEGHEHWQEHEAEVDMAPESPTRKVLQALYEGERREHFVKIAKAAGNVQANAMIAEVMPFAKPAKHLAVTLRDEALALQRENAAALTAGRGR